ncbi:MAG: DNA recombination protein RmuC [Gammaproteobacteria bacterium]|nr:MAG: DNA recombination protein RmuC [Gammaproteobacteria bacterium]
MINLETGSWLLVAIATSIALVAVIILILRSKQFNNLNDELDKELALTHQQLSHLTQQHQKLQLEKGDLEINNKKLTESLADLKAEKAVITQQQLDAKRHFEDKAAIQQTQADEKIELLRVAREDMTKEFNLLANKILDDKAKHWREDSKQSMEGVLTPLKEQLTDFRKKVEDVYDKESKERNSLLHEIGTLKSLNQQMSQDAINLTNALKGDSKIQGNWGEVVLERVLESSGLTKGREYFTQVALKSDTGERYQPDVLVKLPDGKDIILDAKVSLTDYERYCSTDLPEERAMYLKAHIQSIRNHIKGLGAKNYDNLEGINSLDFVFIFIPIEPAYMLAAENEPKLFTDAMAQKIVLVSPTTLLATLRVVENIWRVERQHNNAEEIARQAGDLHDKFVGFIDALEEVGSRLAKATDAYDTAHKRLSSGKGSLVSRTAKLQTLGAKTRKKIDEKLLEDASNTTNNEMNLEDN